MSDTLRNAKEEVRQQLVDALEDIKEDPRIVQITKLHQGLNTLEALTEGPKTSLKDLIAEVLGLDSESALSVQPGEFFGRDQLKAAKMYLKRKGKNGASFDEIVRAIKAGGAKVTSEERLRVSLGRSTLDIAKVGLEHYAMLEFFPHALRGGKRRKAEGESESDTEERLDADTEDTETDSVENADTEDKADEEAKSTIATAS